MLVLSTVLSLYCMGRLGGQVELYADVTLPNNDSVWSIRRNTVSAQRYLARAFVEDGVQSIHKLLEEAGHAEEAALAELEVYAQNQTDTERDEKINELRGLLERTDGIRGEITELMQIPAAANRLKAYELFTKEYTPAFDQVAIILQEFSAAANERAVEQRDESVALNTMAWIIMLASLACPSR
jgi:hypothetical protein